MAVVAERRVTLPADEQILITREFDASTWSTRRSPRRAREALVARQPRRDDRRRDRPPSRRQVAVRDGGGRRFRGRLPRRVPRDRPERADRLHRGLRRDARRGGRQHDDAHRGRRPDDARDPRAALEQGAPGRPHRVRHGSGHAGRDGPPEEVAVSLELAGLLETDRREAAQRRGLLVLTRSWPPPTSRSRCSPGRPRRAPYASPRVSSIRLMCSSARAGKS